MRISSRITGLSALLLASSVASLSGQNLRGAARTFELRAGLFFPTHNAEARLDSEQLGIGTLVDLESDLGLEETTLNFRGDARLRLGRRHQLRAGFIRIDRSSAISLERTIQWGDEEFAIDADVEAFWEMTLIPVHYRFAPVKTDQVDLGLTLGASVTLVDAGITVPAASIQEVESVSFPLPVLGADLEVRPARGLRAGAAVEYFGLEVRDIDGSWLELRGSLEYFPLASVGLGAAYRFTDVSVDTTGDVVPGEGFIDAELLTDYDFRGPQFYVILAP